MATAIRIKHEQSGIVKYGYYGFSWTYLLFGWFAPLFRGELVVAAIHLVFTIATFGLWQLIACFIYNRQFMNRALTEGWVLADSAEANDRAKIALNILD